MQDEREVREVICELGRRMYAREWVAANDGNISCRMGDGRYLCTPDPNNPFLLTIPGRTDSPPTG